MDSLRNTDSARPLEAAPEAGRSREQVITLGPPKDHGGHLDKKEQTSRMLFMLVRDGRPVAPLDVRFYMGRSSAASVVYCRFWLRAADGSAGWSGNGRAGGGGYDKTSAAMQDAFSNAGVAVALNFGGVGSSAMRDAGRAALIAAGWNVESLEVF